MAKKITGSVDLGPRVIGNAIRPLQNTGNADLDRHIHPMPHISIGEVETLPAGSDATATMTGTVTYPILNLGIPRGEPGETGGTGPRGPAGPQGAQGIQGEKGEKGDTGLPGSQGPKGEKGDKGDKGDQGPSGPTGPVGPQGMQGIQGPQGVKGDPGTPGSQGPEGPPGQDYVLTAEDKEEIAGIVLDDPSMDDKYVRSLVPGLWNTFSQITNESGAVTQNVKTRKSALPAVYQRVESVNNGTEYKIAVYDTNDDMTSSIKVGSDGVYVNTRIIVDDENEGTGIEIYQSPSRNIITGLSDPENGTEAVNKHYADTMTAFRTASIPYAQVDNTSTSTAYTATVPGVTEIKDGTCVMLKNGVVTSEAGFTININSLGAYPSYTNLAAATADTTIFNINYTMLFVFDSSRGTGGGWICYRGYDANTNTIGYQLRTNSSTLPMKHVTYRYRLLFASADGKGWEPANTSSSTNATAVRVVNQAPIDPHGPIVYYGTTASVSANSNPAAESLWQEYTLTLGYSFNLTGAALVLPYPRNIYIKCAPQADGSAIIDADTPYVTDLPSAEDGKIYIHLGRTYSATSIELLMDHPVYEYKGGAIRRWTNAPKNLSEFNNDSGYLTLDTLPVYDGSVT